MSHPSSDKGNVAEEEDEFRDAYSDSDDEIIDEDISGNMQDLAFEKYSAKGSPEKSQCPEPRNYCEDEAKAECAGEGDAYGISDDIIDCTDNVDEVGLKEAERDLTEEQKKENKAKAETLKAEGNECFKNGEYAKAIELYTNGLMICPIENCSAERAILYGNRAAAKIQLGSKRPAINDCTKALEFNPEYLKALLRRAKLYEETDKLEECLEDYKAVQKLDPSNRDANYAVIRLPPIINERNEKIKTEMMAKLKDLGNMVLKPFGLSTNNFKMQQDPSTGSYSVNFVQNQ